MDHFDINRLKNYFKDRYSEKDANYIEEVFCDQNNEKELKQLLASQFDELDPEDELSRKNLDQILYRIHYDINMRKLENRAWSLGPVLKWTLRIASVVALPFALLSGIYIFKETRLKKETWIEIKAPAWTRARFSLPDGSMVWLNSNSVIKYNEYFNSDRQVTLTGEAFFDVHTDKKKPFIVKTNEVTVKVTGTRFNIASYDNEKNTEVVLEEGKLVFTEDAMNKSCTMKPHDLVVYDKSMKTFKTEVVLPQKYCAWTEGKLVFRNDPLDVIARRLERWYNIVVEIDVDSPEDIRWRATFMDESLDEVLGLLKRSLPVDYKIIKPTLHPDGTYTKKKVIITQSSR